MSNPIGGDRVKQTAEAEHIGPDYTGDNISAKKTANYVWNGTGWERATPPTTPDDIQNVEIMNAIRTLLQQISVPSWFDPTTNTLRVGTTAVTVSSGTVTTVTTLTNQTNFGSQAADVLNRDISINTWANVARRTIT